MTADELAAAAGVVLSLALTYLPGWGARFAALSPETKRLVLLGLLFLVALGAFGLACGGLAGDFDLPVACDRAGATGLLRAFVLAAIANQGTFSITPKPRAVRRAAASGRARRAAARSGMR
jgi:hypothetical protein